MQRAKLAQKKKDLKISSKELATMLNIKYGTLTMVLCGSYSNLEVEKILLDWLKQKNIENK
jgi:hypothetical protein